MGWKANFVLSISGVYKDYTQKLVKYQKTYLKESPLSFISYKLVMNIWNQSSIPGNRL